MSYRMFFAFFFVLLALPARLSPAQDFVFEQVGFQPLQEYDPDSLVEQPQVGEVLFPAVYFRIEGATVTGYSVQILLNGSPLCTGEFGERPPSSRVVYCNSTWTVENGIHTLEAILDSESEVPETNENNNTGMTVYHIGIPTPTPTNTVQPLTPTATSTNTSGTPAPTSTPTPTTGPGDPTPTLVRPDFNRDGFVDAEDLIALILDKDTVSPPTDLLVDGRIDSRDLWFFSYDWLAKNRQVIPGRTTDIAGILEQPDSQLRLVNENFPFLMRVGAERYYPEVTDLIAFGSDAVDSILEAFQGVAGYVDDTPLCLLAYALEQIGDPSAVPALAEWLEDNMLSDLVWATDFVTHTIKILDGQSDADLDSFTYLVEEKYDTISQARSGAFSKTATHSPVRKSPVNTTFEVCPKTIHVTGIDANGQQRTISMNYNVSNQDIQERIDGSTGTTRDSLIDLQNGYATRDEGVYGGSNYEPVAGAAISTRSNCAGKTIEKIFNELLLRMGSPLHLGPGTSNTTHLNDVARAFGDEVPIDQMDTLTVISHEDSNGTSHHVEVPIAVGPDSVLVLSKDVQGLERTHTVSRNPFFYPYGPIAVAYGERLSFLPGSGTVTTRYYRFDPNRIVNIVVDSSRCACDPNNPDAIPVNISRPAESETGQRVITIEGTVGDPNVTSGATLLVNGSPQNISIFGQTFQAVVVLRSGDNTLAISVETPDGRRGCTERIIRSTTPKTSISATLTWALGNSDVDLYVTQPNGHTAWYQNKNPMGGGRLDVDNTQGFGPENYFLSAPEGETVPTGLYSIRVHYFRDQLADSETPARTVRWRVVVLLDEGTEREAIQIFSGSLSAANSSNASPGASGPDWATATNLNYTLPEDGLKYSREATP